MVERLGLKTGEFCRAGIFSIYSLDEGSRVRVGAGEGCTISLLWF